MESGTTTSPRGTVIEILEDSPERFYFRRRMSPLTGKTARHRHEDFGSERFHVVEGRVTAKLDGRTHGLTAGDTCPLGGTHVHPHTGEG
jgi:hypothetical protein